MRKFASSTCASTNSFFNLPGISHNEVSPHHYHYSRLCFSFEPNQAQNAEETKKICQDKPDQCPIKSPLLEKISNPPFGSIDVTFQFPDIPIHRLDKCESLENRGARVSCVDLELRLYGMETQAGVVTQLKEMPEESFSSYRNYSIMNRLIVKHQDVIWRTALQPNVLSVYEEQMLPIET